MCKKSCEVYFVAVNDGCFYAAEVSPKDGNFKIKSHPQKSFTGSPLLWQGIIKRWTKSFYFCFPSFRVSQKVCQGKKPFRLILCTLLGSNTRIFRDIESLAGNGDEFDWSFRIKSCLGNWKFEDLPKHPSMHPFHHNFECSALWLSVS